MGRITSVFHYFTNFSTFGWLKMSMWSRRYPRCVSALSIKTSDAALYPVYTIQSVVKPVVQPVWQPAVWCKQTSNRLSNWLSNRFHNRLDVCLHDTAGLTTVLNEQPLFVQPVVSCIQTFNRLFNRFDNRFDKTLYHVNGAIRLLVFKLYIAMWLLMNRPNGLSATIGFQNIV